MHVFLRTDRVVLRRFTAADVDLLVELDSDPEVMQYITGGRPTPREEVERDVLPAFLAYDERFAGYGFWAAVEAATGDFLGWSHFRPREGGSLDEAELGYRLRRSAWGKGYATEGSRALIRAGFTEHGVERVVAGAMAVNTASRRVMEKAGLRLVRAFHQPWPYRIEGDEHGDVECAWTAPTGSTVTRSPACDIAVSRTPHPPCRAGAEHRLATRLPRFQGRPPWSSEPGS